MRTYTINYSCKKDEYLGELGRNRRKEVTWPTTLGEAVSNVLETYEVCLLTAKNLVSFYWHEDSDTVKATFKYEETE